jgi:hypothetical protein
VSDTTGVLSRDCCRLQNIKNTFAGSNAVLNPAYSLAFLL